MIKTYILTPLQKFIKIESFSGILLFTSAIIAILWANSTFGDSYAALWQHEVGFGVDDFGLRKSLLFWINDGLMAIFFFLIGLEIKRELVVGELNSIRKATFPIFAGIGGMIFPLLLFLLLNDKPETAHGWGIPMATDIAFTLAILTLLKKSVPISLKIFLTAFAIIDDLGAVIVIAVFYSEGVDWVLLGIAIGLLLILFAMSHKGKYNKFITIAFGAIIWVLFLKAGIHPTISGVLLAFTIPIRQKLDKATFLKELSTISEKLALSGKTDLPIHTQDTIKQMDNLDDLLDDFHSPLQNLEHKLHGWVAYFIMPVFALANAGVVFASDMSLETDLMIHITMALVLGKFIGVSLFSYLAVKLKLAELPTSATAWQIMGIAILSGVGFTMSIFIANLAYIGNAAFIDSAKIGILIGSLIAGVLGALVLQIAGKKYREAQ
ncbi:Na+:H+ antiporter, NhaA family [Arenibacter nanhaiticus]|uniref:Na(+)/H(+) antiporter NhaA n=1 Tax=Arenibacter nanhaiticus TaxID=558155 RepID=A0A1M6KP77_9FLAO|nr:Na+/H+ antiporter NhaA [Arenibacter nanhaiticus]SHJ60692.1 Na+:H+ antiporter, NhaA family [Arenibacter nanhaiticus]